jgi:hypothetical protein
MDRDRVRVGGEFECGCNCYQSERAVVQRTKSQTCHELVHFFRRHIAIHYVSVGMLIAGEL